MSWKPFEGRLAKGEDKLDEVFGADHILGFREDVEEVCIDHIDSSRIEENPKQLVDDVRKAVEMSKQRVLTVENGVNKLQLVDGLTGGVLAVGIYQVLKYLDVGQINSLVIGSVVFLLFTLLNHGILYSKAFINLACYTSASPREKRPTLHFKRAWNGLVLSSNTSILGVMVVAGLRGVVPNVYSLGLNRLERIAESTGFEDLSDWEKLKMSFFGP